MGRFYLLSLQVDHSGLVPLGGVSAKDIRAALHYFIGGAEPVEKEHYFISEGSSPMVTILEQFAITTAIDAAIARTRTPGDAPGVPTAREVTEARNTMHSGAHYVLFELPAAFDIDAPRGAAMADG